MGSVLLDLLLLFEHVDQAGAVTAALRTAPYGLGQLVAEQLAAFLEDPQRRTRALRLAGEATGGRLAPTRLTDGFGGCPQRLFSGFT